MLRQPLNRAQANVKTLLCGAPATRPHVDLRRILRAQLEEAGIAKASIDDVCGCTVCDADRFFSFRRDRGVTGRMLSAIVATGSAAAQR